MALQRLKYPLILNKGIDTKTDEKIVQGNLLVGENIVFPTSVPTKRLGYLPFSTIGITEGKALSTYKDELLLFGDEKLRSYAEPTNQWIEKGSFLPVNISQENIIRNDNAQGNPDIAEVGDVIVTVWDEITSTGRSAKYSVYTKDSETYYVSDGTIDSDGRYPRIGVIENSFVITYQSISETNKLKTKTIAAGAPTVLLNGTTITTTSQANGAFDLVEVSGNLVIAYRHTGNKVNILVVDKQGNNSNAIAEKITGMTTAGIFSIETSNNQQTVWVVSKSATNVIQYQTLPFPSGTLSSITDVGTQANCQSISLIADSNTQMTLFYDSLETVVANSFISKSVITTTPSASTPVVITKSMFLNSKPFKENNINYVIGTHISYLQPTHFLLNENGCVLSNLNSGLAGTRENVNSLTSILKIDNKFTFPLSIRNKLISNNNAIYFTQGLTETKIDFDNFNYSVGELADNLIIGGGQVSSYDGSRIVENNFLLYPEGITATGTATQTDSYQYKTVYKWTDGQGNTHYSAPSLVATSNSNASTITTPTLRITEKTNVQIELYRSPNLGTAFYFVREVPNNKTVDTLTIVSNVTSDLTLVSQKPLYSQPDNGILENTIPPTASIVKAHKSRIFLAGLADENKIAYSKLTGGGAPVGFNLDLNLNIDAKGGPITALETMDNYLVIFKRDNIYLLTGEGPNNQGLRNTFSIPKLIAGDVGCTDPNSVALTELGIVFKSAKGIYLLERNGRAKYIGAPVEKFNNETITSSVVIDDDNEIRFTTNAGNVIVYNYFHAAWTIFTGITAVDADIWKDRYVHLNSSGKVSRETDGVYKDDGIDIPIKMTTEWIKFDGVSGFGRVYMMNMIGEWKTPHALRITIKYNYSNTYLDTYLYAPNDQFNQYFSTTELFSATELFNDGEIGTYDFSLYPSVQKCESFQITLEDVVDNSLVNGGESFNMTAITMDVGIKPGLFKHRSSHVVS